MLETPWSHTAARGGLDWRSRRDRATARARANVNAEHLEAGSTPLHYAVITNHLEAAKMLLDKGADINARNRSGGTCLQLAAERGYIDIARFLLGRGAEADAKTSPATRRWPRPRARATRDW